MDACVRTSLGLPPFPDGTPAPARTDARYVGHCGLALRPGTITELSTEAELAALPGVLDVVLHHRVGDRIAGHIYSASAAGFVHVGADTEEEVRERLATVRAAYRIRTRPDGTGQDGTGQDGTGQDGTGQDGTGPDGTGPENTRPEGPGAESAAPDSTAPDRTCSGHHRSAAPDTGPRRIRRPPPAPSPRRWPHERRAHARVHRPHRPRRRHPRPGRLQRPAHGRGRPPPAARQRPRRGGAHVHPGPGRHTAAAGHRCVAGVLAAPTQDEARAGELGLPRPAPARRARGDARRRVRGGRRGGPRRRLGPARRGHRRGPGCCATNWPCAAPPPGGTVPQPAFTEATGPADVDALRARHGGRCVLKPANRQASLGVVLMDPGDDTAEAGGTPSPPTSPASASTTPTPPATWSRSGSTARR
ncbi:hypothetical protein KMB26_27305 [Streptomyces sp. CYG20]|uniref:hypothetical protein n=1 Tax=Streptomyces sp. CYG20 TaxID=2838873 RepID=UPI001BFEF67B|nr:hypothetical protein [Streptomyces sp. CYG20]MBT3112782.1 hypothetical protein [Streptomyces sp. CYG20]